MKESSTKKLKEYRDPLLEAVNLDIACFNRFADVYGVPLEHAKQAASGREHGIIGVEYSSKVMTDKGELILRLGYTFERKKSLVEVATYVGVERDLDTAHLTHNIRSDVWQLRASVTDSGKLLKLLGEYGIENGQGTLELKRSRYLLAARDLIAYFGGRRERHSED